MFKNLLRIFLIVTIILIVFILYLSLFGVKTDKFNELIKNQISIYDNRISLDFDDVFIKLNIRERSFSLNSKDINFYLNKEKQKIENIDIIIGLTSFLEKDIRIKKVIINSKENKIKNLLKLINAYRISVPALFLENKIKKGNIIYNIVFNYYDNNLNQIDLSGKITETKINIFGNEKIDNLNFNFNYKDKNLEIINLKLKYKDTNFNSQNINVNLKNNLIKIKGNFNNKSNLNLLSSFLNNNIKNYLDNDILLLTKSDFELNFNNKFKIINYKLNSRIEFNDLNIKLKNLNLKKHITNFENKIILKNGKINFKIDNQNKIETEINSNYVFTDKNKPKEFSFKYVKSNSDEKYKFNIDLNSSEIILDDINFKKKENEELFLTLVAVKKRNKFEIKNLKLFNNKNKFNLKNIKFGKDFHISDFNLIAANYYNNDKYLNNISIIKKNNIINLNSKSFDISSNIEKILRSQSKGSFLDIFENLNASININIKSAKLDKEYNLNNLSGKVLIKNSEIYKANILGKFDTLNNFIFTKDKIENNKVTTIFSDIAKPFVKKFKFIKGFEGGKLDFTSTEIKKDILKSELRIYEFKLQDMPALTKLLSLASLQGIADLATGEGIRFNEFDMFFVNSEDLITINEIYALGPAISILMEGYVEKNRLVSLKGTLVPATTINKSIAKIPLLGNILVGEKAGEGVFGVSFKIKGPPNQLDTRVNPIKTLTPRFITRTLNKLKKSN